MKKAKINWSKLIAFILGNIANIILMYALYKNNLDFVTFLVVFYSFNINMLILK